MAWHWPTAGCFLRQTLITTGRFGSTARSIGPQGVIAGINAQQRVEVSPKAVAGAKHVIACLVANGPLAEPRGGIFMRYATLAFESRD